MAFDLVVAGAGFGGLAAATLLAHTGKKVLLLEPEREIGGVHSLFRKDGFQFTTGPTLSFGFEKGGELERLSAELGIKFGVSVNSPVFQVALPDRRINIYAETGETLEELGREFKDEIDTISKMYRDIRKMADNSVKNRVYAYIVKNRGAAGFIGKYSFSREFLAFLDIQSYSFFGRGVLELSLPLFILLIDNTPLSVHGGFVRFMDQMQDVFLKKGGEIRYGVPWPMVIQSTKKGVVLSTDQGTIEAKAFLLNSSRRKQGTVLFLGIKDEVVPVGMAFDVISLPAYGRTKEFFTLSLNNISAEAYAPSGMRGLTASFPFLLSGSVDGARLMDKIGSIIPFLEQYTVFSHEHIVRHRDGNLSSEGFKMIPLDGKSSLLYRSPSSPVYFIPDGEGIIETARAVRGLKERLI